jgi:hypothetical protein
MTAVYHDEVALGLNRIWLDTPAPRRATRARAGIQRFPGEDLLHIGRTEPRLRHRRRIDQQLHVGTAPGQNVSLEPGREFDDEDRPSGIHFPLDPIARKVDRRLEIGRTDRIAQAQRQVGTVVVDHPDRRVRHFGLHPFGHETNGDREREQDQEHQHGVLHQAAQFLGGKETDIGEPQSHAACFPRLNRAAKMNVSAKTPSAA